MYLSAALTTDEVLGADVVIPKDVPCITPLTGHDPLVLSTELIPVVANGVVQAFRCT